MEEMRHMARRFNPPPGWPKPSDDWQPPPGWQPDPSWPPAPPGWQLWIDDEVQQPRWVPAPADTREHVAGRLFAKGRNGQITVEGDWLTIGRKGLGRIGHSKGDRRVPLAQITAVQVRPAGPIANGFIKFSLPGSPELRGGLSDATKDENAVVFTRKQQPEFEAVRAYVERYLTARYSTQSSYAQTTTSTADPMEQLRKLAELRDAGVVTPEEFEAKKAELLSRM